MGPANQACCFFGVGHSVPATNMVYIYSELTDHYICYAFNINVDKMGAANVMRILYVITIFYHAQLSTEERLYLHAARLGDYALLREILDLDETTPGDLRRINVNCLDYMGRNALHLAVDSESVECIELLLDTINWECQEEVSGSQRGVKWFAHQLAPTCRTNNYILIR